MKMVLRPATTAPESFIAVEDVALTMTCVKQNKILRSTVIPQDCGFVTFDKSEVAQQAILDRDYIYLPCSVKIYY